MSIPDVRQITLEAVAAAAETEVGELAKTVDIFDLGLDSLDFWGILMDIEDGLGIEVPAHVLDQIAQLQGEVTIDELLAILAAWYSTINAGDAHDGDLSIHDVVVIEQP